MGTQVKFSLVGLDGLFTIGGVIGGNGVTSSCSSPARAWLHMAQGQAGAGQRWTRGGPVWRLDGCAGACSSQDQGRYGLWQLLGESWAHLGCKGECRDSGTTWPQMHKPHNCNPNMCLCASFGRQSNLVGRTAHSLYIQLN